MGGGFGGISRKMAGLERQSQRARAQRQFREAQAEPELVWQQLESRLRVRVRPQLFLFSPAERGVLFKLRLAAPAAEHFAGFV